MKKIVFLFFSCFLIGCNSDKTSEIEKIELCTEFPLEQGHHKLNAINDEIWEKGPSVRVRFLNGDSFLHNKVIKYANEWTTYSGITFSFVDQGFAEIRVGFYPNKGSWSIIGNDSEKYSVNMDTGKLYESSTGISMNFGWFDEHTEEKEFSRTILHEFGHALGLIHEHQAPDAGIRWNRNIYYYYKVTQGWSKEEVDNNIVFKYDKSILRGGKYDKTSIMHYSIPKELLEKGSEEFGENYYLSEQDKVDINEIYTAKK